MGLTNFCPDIFLVSPVPVAAVHPMRGGRAPTRLPTHVLTTLFRLRGVYTQVYRRMLVTPRRAVVRLVVERRTQVPLTPNREANSSAV